MLFADNPVPEDQSILYAFALIERGRDGDHMACLLDLESVADQGWSIPHAIYALHYFFETYVAGKGLGVDELPWRSILHGDDCLERSVEVDQIVHAIQEQIVKSAFEGGDRISDNLFSAFPIIPEDLDFFSSELREEYNRFCGSTSDVVSKLCVVDDAFRMTRAQEEYLRELELIKEAVRYLRAELALPNVTYGEATVCSNAFRLVRGGKPEKPDLTFTLGQGDGFPDVDVFSGYKRVPGSGRDGFPRYYRAGQDSNLIELVV